MSVEEHTIDLAGSPVYLRRTRVPADRPTPVYLHGIPTSSDDWIGMLERTGGLAPDLLGFGRTGKGGQLDPSPRGQAEFLAALLDATGVNRVRLVGHDWGAAAAMALAATHPDRIDRLAMLSPVISPPSTTLARLLRLPGAGELVMGTVTRRLLARHLRRSTTRPDLFPDGRIDDIWGWFDQGTQRAILRLHRASAGIGALPADLPTLVLWGEDDRTLDPAPARALAASNPNTGWVTVEHAAHWPWLESPAAADRLAGFVLAP